MKSISVGKLVMAILWMVWLSACSPVTVPSSNNNQPTPAGQKSSLLDTAPVTTPRSDLLTATSIQTAAVPPLTSSSNDLPGLGQANPAVPVTIDEPQDDAVVQDSHVQIKGEANPGTVLSINDEIVLVDATRKFSVQIQLDEGLNVIEIVASDEQGNQESQYLSITFEPQ